MRDDTLSFSVLDAGAGRIDRVLRAARLAGTALPVLEQVLTPSDTAQWQAAGTPGQAAAAPGPAAAIDIDLARFDEWLARRLDPDGWTCHTDSVRAQLESVVCRLPPPTAAAPVVLRLPPGPAPVAGTVQLSAELRHPAPAPGTTRPATLQAPAPAPAPAAAPDAAAALVEAATRRADDLARQVALLTRRAEEAEAKVLTLQARIDADERCQRALGRRFGQRPQELFAVFVARLGMTAKAVAAARDELRLVGRR